MEKNFISSILVVIIISCMFIIIKIFIFNNSVMPKEPLNITKEKIKSGNLSVDYEIDKVLEDVEILKLNTVNVPVIINIKTLTDSDMSIDKNSMEKAKKIIKKLKKKNINVILEAYPWINDGKDYETEWNPNNIDLFFYNWEHKVLLPLIEEIANPYKVFALNTASNFSQMEKYEEKWCYLIQNIKSKYKGLTTYRTSWWYTASWDKVSEEKYRDKLENRVFNNVDFISIAAYFELSNKNINSKDELVKYIEETKAHNRNQNIKKEIYNFYKMWEKPIFFGELGFPKLEGASKEPWNVQVSKKLNTQEQVVGFLAYKEVFEDEPWQLGFSIFAIGKDDNTKVYYPSRETKKVIKDWYKKRN
ncbi:glycoside hydrolase family 113 [Clostridium senegalense]